MFDRLRAIAKSLKRELAVHRAVAKHPQTPRVAKWLLGLAIGYALLPIDIIPDFIPVLGHLDDVVVIPGFVVAALWLVPSEVVSECRSQASPVD